MAAANAMWSAIESFGFLIGAIGGGLLIAGLAPETALAATALPYARRRAAARRHRARPDARVPPARSRASTIGHEALLGLPHGARRSRAAHARRHAVGDARSSRAWSTPCSSSSRSTCSTSATPASGCSTRCGPSAASLGGVVALGLLEPWAARRRPGDRLPLHRAAADRDRDRAGHRRRARRPARARRRLHARRDRRPHADAAARLRRGALARVRRRREHLRREHRHRRGDRARCCSRCSARARALAVVGAALPLLAIVRWRTLARFEAGHAIPARPFALLRGVPLFAPLPVASVENLALRMDAVPDGRRSGDRPPGRRASASS